MNTKTTKEVQTFMEAVFPEGAQLAMAAFDERYVLQTAVTLIVGLRADNTGLRTEIETVKADANSTVGTYRSIVDRLEQWRDTVTIALANPGGTRYDDVPQHIRDNRDLIKRLSADLDRLADAIVGPYRKSAEDAEMWTIDAIERDAAIARCAWQDEYKPLAEAAASLLKHIDNKDLESVAAYDVRDELRRRLEDQGL